MQYKNIFDSHTHSANSFDGNHSCDELCLSALNQGALGLSVTDHCEIDMKDFNPREFAKKQFAEITESRDKFAGKLKVSRGIEIGQAIYNIPLSEEILSGYDYDFVLGSIHNLENMEDFYFLDYKDYDIDSLLKQYFENELKLALWGNIDSLAHLTYPLRYIVAREHINVDLHKYYDIIEAIFKTLIEKGIALELNVSGLFMDMKDTLPNKQLIEFYHSLGGELVTVGSDSHFKEKICRGIDRGYDILKQCGYKSVAVYEKRKACLIAIK